MVILASKSIRSVRNYLITSNSLLPNFMLQTIRQTMTTGTNIKVMKGKLLPALGFIL